MPLISIMTACFNEEQNVKEVYERVKAVITQQLPGYTYEHIFIDNCSTDSTVSILREIATHDTNVKIIVNARNFGHIRSPFFGLMQGKGDVVMSIVSDLQDPPELIPAFIKKWEEGYKIVVGVKVTTEESRIMSFLRKSYYHLISKIANTKQIKNFTGFGLYDKQVISALKNFNDPYPYFRGMISEVGFEIAELPYHQPLREEGKTKNNLYTLYDMAMLGITSYSNVPIRLAILFGFLCSAVSIIVAIVFFILKLMFWQHFTVGIAPILIGFFFFAGVQLFFIGLLGEYISSIHTHVKKRPLVFVKETVNIDV